MAIWLILILVLAIIISNLMLLKYSSKFKPPANFHKKNKNDDAKHSEPREK